MNGQGLSDYCSVCSSLMRVYNSETSGTIHITLSLPKDKKGQLFSIGTTYIQHINVDVPPLQLFDRLPI